MNKKEKAGELQTRRIIYKYILKHPGLHERELARQLNLPLGTLDYHLYYLKKQELVTTASDGHYTQYYISGKISSKDKKLIATLRHEALRKIIIFLLLENSSYHREICEHLKLARSTTTFHLNKLVELEIINRTQKGRDSVFDIKDPQHISNLIITYKKSFLDDAVNRFADTWLELHPRQLRKTKRKKED